MSIRHLVSMMLLGAAVWAPLSSTAQTVAGEAPPTTITLPTTNNLLFVPYEKLLGPQFGPGQSVLLPYAEFLELKAAAKAAATTVKHRPLVSLAQASFRGTVEGGVARFEAEYRLETLAEPQERLEVRLPFADLAIESVMIEGPQASLAPLESGTGLRVILFGGGTRVVRLRFATRLTAEGAVRRLDFRVPRAAAASLSLTVNEDVVLAPIPDALPTVSLTPLAGRPGAAVQGVELKASFGSRERVRFAFRPRLEKTGAAAQIRFTVEQNCFFTISAQSARASVKMNVELLSGETDAFVFLLPEEARLLNVSGPFVKDWTTPDAAGSVKVSLVRPVSEPFSLTLDCQLAAPADPQAPLVIPAFSVPGAVREAGQLILAPDDGVSIWPEEQEGLEAAPAAISGARAARAFRFAQPGWKLSITRRPISARVRANSILLYEVTEELLRLKSRHRLTISARSLFNARFEAPEGYELREAGPPETVAGFRQQGRIVEVNFRGEQTSASEVELVFQRSRSPEESQIILEPIVVLGAEEDAGAVVVAMPVALRASELSLSGLEATDVRTLQSELANLQNPELIPVLGYRYFAPRFRAVAGIERQRTRLTCETALLASITPSLMSINATMDFNVEFSATDEFQVLTPASAGRNVRINGADIKEKTPAFPAPGAAADAPTTWTIRLQRRVLGPYRLQVSFDIPLAEAEPGKPLIVSTPLVRAGGVDRETGHIGISRGENLEVRVKEEQEGLEVRDVQELPPELSGAFLGFRYFEPLAAPLELELIRHELESVLGAIIRRMHIETVLSDQRIATHQVIFEVQNNREQYLELALPEEMEIWGAFVSGAPTRSSIRQADQARLIELPKSATMDQAFNVRLILHETLPGGNLGMFGRLSFEPPRPLNIQVLRMTWKLYLPEKYNYLKFRGAMRFEQGGHLPWIVPALERLVNDFPARLAGGIAQPTLNPQQANAPYIYNSTETEAEKRARLQGAALDIPIVYEGLIFHFSKLSGVGNISASYWKNKPLLIFQGALWLIVCGALIWAMLQGWPLARAALVFVVLFIFASLTDGFFGRVFATSYAAAAVACIIQLITLAMKRSQATAAAPALAPAPAGAPPAGAPPAGAPPAPPVESEPAPEPQPKTKARAKPKSKPKPKKAADAKDANTKDGE